MATRAASGKAIQWVAANVPELVGGSADLASSNNTDIADGGDVVTGRLRRAQPPLRRPRARDGRDRQRPRAARLQGLRRHVPDLLRLHARRGPALGADEAADRSGSGPTTRSGSARTARRTSRSSSIPALRAMPNLSVIRPADAQRDGRWPGSTRSTRPTTRRRWSSPARTCRRSIRRASRPTRSRRGAYVLRDSRRTRRRPGDPDRHRQRGADRARGGRPARGGRHRGPRGQHAVRWPLRRAAPVEYRDSVLPPSVRARVSVEAAATFGWHRWVGDLGEAVGMHELRRLRLRRGTLYEHFGITAEHVAEAARTLACNRAQSN